MAQVTIRINGYPYTVGCADGQEGHLNSMASEIDRRVDQVKALGNQSGESRMLVLAALLMADEIHDMQIAPADGAAPAARDLTPELNRLRADLARAEARAEAAEAHLVRFAQRAEEIAEALEHH
ncbi:cell division protein ZapA [Endobacter medicaginis]|jgi:cell division protein ZapA|uniref:Cell division protein ZapA n=1 Tax=Endobacter medicaginis TaxID=1181271 RepID=A0A839UZG9_9PROT|nr:cell division protein ZapA [Endobacter medicaginis]MBB3173520.1 cell division protein ZapA [Endobacter medicaginis]MCX5475391.1 cell division protein ZapA [Endobacter medicaginis]NVN29850.1 cell division protein ZapA [Endobacter medicaginis]